MAFLAAFSVMTGSFPNTIPTMHFTSQAESKESLTYCWEWKSQDSGKCHHIFVLLILVENHVFFYLIRGFWHQNRHHINSCVAFHRQQERPPYKQEDTWWFLIRALSVSKTSMLAVPTQSKSQSTVNGPSGGQYPRALQILMVLLLDTEFYHHFFQCSQLVLISCLRSHCSWLYMASFYEHIDIFLEFCQGFAP